MMRVYRTTALSNIGESLPHNKSFRIEKLLEIHRSPGRISGRKESEGFTMSDIGNRQ
jgi:hypothetical protein